MKEQLIIYPEFDERIGRDFLYTVSVTQRDRTERLPVYNHTEDSRVNRNPVDGRRADEFRRFCTFACLGGVRVDIRVNRDFHDYAVIPAAKHFRHSFRDGVISVYLDRPDYFAVRLDGGDHTLLAVFADEPETELPVPGEKTRIVDRWQEAEGGILTVTEPGTTVYIPAGCVLNARVRILADDCRVIGRGAIVDPVGDIYRYNAEKLDTGVVLVVCGASRVRIDGVHLLDSKAFNVEVIGIWEKKWAEDNCVRNVKILSTQMSSDGITFCYYARNSLAEHCFVYCGDNALVYEDYAHYRDITVGTTCNALFPQTDVIDSSAEDVNIFRADEGIINCEYTGEGGRTRIERHRIRNLSAMDVTFTPYFLFVEVPGTSRVVSGGGGLTVENIWLPRLSDTRTPVFCQNLAQGDYAVTLRNLSVGGETVRTVTPETVGGTVNTAGQTFRCETSDGFDPVLLPNRSTVNYRNAVNVFVGTWQVFFRHPVIREGEAILLPAAELARELRTEALAKTLERDGTAYVRLSDVTAAGMARAVRTEGNAVILTPNRPQGNLLLPDCGIVSKFTEYICYASHMVTLREDGETVYRIINTARHKSVGLFRLIGEEIGKYGAGDYRLTFYARAGEETGIRAAIDYSERVCREVRIPLMREWRRCEVPFTVAPEELAEPKIAIIIGGNGETVTPEFDLKRIALEKQG